jgi:hypothetical protein
MSRRLKQAAVLFVVVFAAAQLVRPERVNPSIDVSRTIQAHEREAGGMVAVLDRACGDCHSNSTVWPWYTQVAPLSWLMAYAVREGRNAVNFSEWAGYSAGEQRTLLVASCHDATEGKMPGRPWTMLHPETQLSAHDIDTICDAARRAEADGGR